MKKSKKRNFVVIALIVMLLALAVGYAAFSQTLTITGTATGNTTWDVKFTSATLDAAANHGTATVSADGKTITAAVTLNYPGDAVKLTAVVKNNGTLPAKLTAFNITNPTSTDVTVTAANPTVNEVLQPGATCTTEYVIKWATASTATSISDTFTVTFDYTQETTEVNITPSHSDAAGA